MPNEDELEAIEKLEKISSKISSKKPKMEGLTPGRIVHFILSEQDATEINKRRKDADLSRKQRGNNAIDIVNFRGFQEHIGNHAEAGDHLPMIIVKVWNAEIGMVNGKVFLDGNDDYWVTSVTPGDETNPHSWHWIEKA